MQRVFGRIIVSSAMIIGMAACATAPQLYSWGNYNRELRDYYKQEYTTLQFAEMVLVDIAAAETENMVPPGLYAEYGYLMLLEGNTGTAIAFFEKEAALWPEAEPLMEKVIKNLETTASATSDL